MVVPIAPRWRTVLCALALGSALSAACQTDGTANNFYPAWIAAYEQSNYPLLAGDALYQATF